MSGGGQPLSPGSGMAPFSHSAIQDEGTSWHFSGGWVEVPTASSQARVGNRLHSFSLHSSWAQKGLGSLSGRDVPLAALEGGGQAEAPS